MSTEIEIWKTIPNYKDYQVSNLGRVKSLNYRNTKKEKILKLSKNNHGYLSCGLNCKIFKVHQLVAIAFLNHKPNGFNLVVNHKDFNKTNNNVNNLEIVTMRENTNQKHLKSTSKYIGVSWNKAAKKWKCELTFNKKRKYLGYFENEYEAHLAYVKFIKQNT